MKHGHSVQVATRIALVRIQQEYAACMNTSTFSLQELFNHDQFRLSDYCQHYVPHPQTGQLVEIVQEFGERYGVWLPNARHYVTSALFLFPDADFTRATALVKNLATDYYLNDTMGRELFKYLTPVQQEASRQIIQRMVNIDDRLETIPGAHGIELANAEMLAEIRDIAPPDWFMEFLKLYSYHIEVTHKDCSAAALGYVPTVDEYISMRNHTSGMPHIILLAEYSDNRFLDWDWLASVKMDVYIRRIHRATALFGCLTNDLFSFEKEVIDKNADSNLVMAVALNYPELTFEETVLYASAIVRKVLVDFFELLANIRGKLNQLPESEAVDTVQVHLGTMEKIVQASWMWQIFTRRYKRPVSIWQETSLVEETKTVTV